MAAIEKKSYIDSNSGREVVQLTDYRGNSHHFYFTNSGWYDDNRRLLISSDRNNCTNLYGIELETGEIEPVTELDCRERSFLSACVNPEQTRVYFRDGDNLCSVDLRTRRLEVLSHFDPAWHLNMMNVSADSNYVYYAMFEDADHMLRNSIRNGTVREVSPKFWERNPLSRIVRVPCAGGEAEIVHEEPCWIAHANTSPTHPELLTFCHEGPWQKVGQRIWLLNVNTGARVPLRPPVDGETVGHEYWFADGERLGYHGRHNGVFFFGSVRLDGSYRDFEFPGDGATGHTFSLDESQIVGDGEGFIKLWRLKDGSYQPPEILCFHGTSARIQKTHAHPRISPDGGYVVFTSDRTGYGNVYLTRIP